MIVNAFQPAARLGDFSEPVEYVERSLLVIARLLEGLENYNISKIIYTSSASVYGNSSDCCESDRLSADGLHAGLKVAAESLIRAVCEARGINFTIARVFNMYGGVDHFSIISKIISAASQQKNLLISNNGSAIRDFIHVDDVARVYKQILDIQGLPIVNVASGTGVSISNVIDSLSAHGTSLNVTPIRRDNEIKFSVMNVEKLSSFIDIMSFVRVTDFVVREVIF